MPIDVTSSTVVPRPVPVVWDWVRDPQNDLRWTSGLVEVRPLVGASYDTGARIERVARFLGRTFAYTIDVTEVEPLRRIEMTTSAGPFPMTVSYLFDEVDGGTRFSIRNRGEPGRWFALVGGLLAGAVQRQVQLDVDTLRDLLTADVNRAG